MLSLRSLFKIGADPTGGLKPQKKDPVTGERYHQLARQAGEMLGLKKGDIPDILCFGPCRLEKIRRMTLGPLRRFLVAVHVSDLPERLGLDWSFDEAINCADRLGAGSKFRPEGIFVRSVLEAHSFVAYDPVALGALRVKLKRRSKQNPRKWPLLEHTEEADMHSFSGYAEGLREFYENAGPG